jgi:hypothetical protein
VGMFGHLRPADSIRRIAGGPQLQLGAPSVKEPSYTLRSVIFLWHLVGWLLEVRDRLLLGMGPLLAHHQ